MGGAGYGGRKPLSLAFRNRFSQAEKVYIEIMSLDQPAAAMAVRQQAAEQHQQQGAQLGDGKEG